MVLFEPREEPDPPPIPEGKAIVNGEKRLILEQIVQWYGEYILKYREAFLQSEGDKESARNYINNIIEEELAKEKETKE